MRATAVSSGTVKQVCESHGAALYWLAHALVGDPNEAETIVVQSLADACAGQATSRGLGSMRRTLARCVYRRSTTLSDPSQAIASPADQLAAPYGSAMSAMSGMAGMAGLGVQQRAAIALSVAGDHGCADIARLMGLPKSAVVELLSSGLAELAQRSEPSVTSLARRA